MNAKERKQLVIFEKIVGEEISQTAAARRLDVSDRWIRKKLVRYKKEGAKGLVHRSRGKLSLHRWCAKEQELAIELLTSDWIGFSASFAVEKLKERFNITISRETLRKVLIRERLWKKRRHRPKHRRWRERKKVRGIMIQLDGSPHDWFEGRGPKCTLLVFIDDATSEILWLEFVPSESLHSVMQAEMNYIRKHGIPESFYVDFGSVFSVNTNNPDREKITQFKRVNEELGVTIIHARSPQAKGRVERANKTLQDRLTKEMRLRNIASIEDANQFAQNEYLNMHNKLFAVQAATPGDAHIPLDKNVNLSIIFCIKEARILTNDYTISYKRRLVQLEKQQQAFIRPKNTIEVREHLNGKLTLYVRGIPLNFKEIGMKLKTRLSPVEYIDYCNNPSFTILNEESRVKTAMPAVEATL